MIAFSAIQQHCRDTIAAAAPFAADAAQTVLVDLGLAQDAEEAALSAHGYVITVLPPLNADTADQAGSKATARTGLCVRVAVQPKPSDQVNVYSTVAAVHSALLGFAPTQPADRYRLAAKPLVLDDADPGLLAYLLFFEKTCLL